RGSVLEPAARTAIGVDKRGRVLLVVVEGRQKGWSAGVTLEELAYLMAELGAVRAAALDGGGSSGMWVKGRLVSRPSEGRERGLADAILVLRQVPVYLNGSRIFFDVPPVVDGGRILVPMRGIFEVLGATVHWDEKTGTVTATRGGCTISLTPGKGEALVDGRTVPLDAPARVVEGRVMVPLRLVGQALGAAVTWQDAPPAVIIEAKPVK
ncbi:MAG: stalk domain-containing protein, partial [Desulfofundulus sp.]